MSWHCVRDLELRIGAWQLRVGRPRRRAGIARRGRRGGDPVDRGHLGGGDGARLLPAQEVHDGPDGGAPDVRQVGEGGGHGEQPRRVREVEARGGGAAVQRYHCSVVRARGGLGGDVDAEPEPLAALPGHPHLAHSPAVAAPAAHAVEPGTKLLSEVIKPLVYIFIK